MTASQESQHSITVVPVPGPGAEDVVVATHGPDEGSVFTGTGDGAIWRVSPDGAKADRVAETAGRPLGLEIDPDGRLLVCDDSGAVVHDIDVQTDRYNTVTGVREHDGRVWLGSLYEPAIAVVSL